MRDRAVTAILWRGEMVNPERKQRLWDLHDHIEDVLKRDEECLGLDLAMELERVVGKIEDLMVAVKEVKHES